MHHIGQIEDKISFRSVVLSDLQNVGVKINKARRRSASHMAKEKQTSSSQSSTTTSSIFHRPLDEVPSSIADDELLGHMFVPSFLVEAFYYLRSHYSLEGIFRKSGSVQRQKELKGRIEIGCLDFADAQPNDVTSVVKEFFRNLPEPLLPFHFHDAFLKVMSFSDEVIDPSTSLTKEDAMTLLCCLLPMSHLTTLRFVLCELNKISMAEENKMDVTNLALIMTPNFMPAPKDERDVKHLGTQGEESKSLNRRTEVVIMLIGMTEKIGSVPLSVFERSRMMSTLFPSTNKNDFGDNSRGGDDRTQREDDKPKIKRKKRSASFSEMRKRLSNGLAHVAEDVADGLVSGLSEGFAWLKGSRSNLNANYNVTCEVVQRPAHHQNYDPAGLPPATPRSLYKMEPYTPKIISNHANTYNCGSTKRRAALNANIANSPFLPLTPSMKSQSYMINASPILHSRQSRARHRGHNQEASGELPIDDVIKHKRNSSCGRIEGVKSRPRSPDTVSDVTGGHRRAMSLIKKLSNSFNSEESVMTSKSDYNVNDNSLDSMNIDESKVKKKGAVISSRRHKHPSSPAGSNLEERRKNVAELRATKSSDDLTEEDKSSDIISMDDNNSSLSEESCFDGGTNFSSGSFSSNNDDMAKSFVGNSVAMAPMSAPEEISLVNRFNIGLEDMEDSISLSPALFDVKQSIPGSIQTPGKGQILSYLTKMSESTGLTDDQSPQQQTSTTAEDMASPLGFGQYLLADTPSSSEGSPSGVTRRRSLSEGDRDAIFTFARVSGLRRGKPNSQQVGLMSPLTVTEKRRSWRSSLSENNKTEAFTRNNEHDVDDHEMIVDFVKKDGVEVSPQSNYSHGISSRFCHGMKELADRYYQMETFGEKSMQKSYTKEESKGNQSHDYIVEPPQELNGSNSSYGSFKSCSSKNSLQSVCSHESSCSKSHCRSSDTSGASDLSVSTSFDSADVMTNDGPESETEITLECGNDLSLLHAIESHLRANRLMNSEDVIANVEVIEEQEGGEASRPESKSDTVTIVDATMVFSEHDSPPGKALNEEEKKVSFLEAQIVQAKTTTITNEDEDESPREIEGIYPIESCAENKLVTMSQNNNFKISDARLQSFSPKTKKMASSLRCGHNLDGLHEINSLKRGSVSNLHGSGKVSQRVARFQEISASSTEKNIKKSTITTMHSQEQNLPRIHGKPRPSPLKSRPSAASLRVKALTGESTIGTSYQRSSQPRSAVNRVVEDKSRVDSLATTTNNSAKPLFPSVPSVKKRSTNSASKPSSIPHYSRKFQSPVKDVTLKDNTNLREEPQSQASSIKLRFAERENASRIVGARKRHLNDKIEELDTVSPRKSPKSGSCSLTLLK